MKPEELNKKVEELQADPEALKNLVLENESLKSDAKTDKKMISDLNKEIEESSSEEKEVKVQSLNISKKKYKLPFAKFRAPGINKMLTIDDLKANELEVTYRSKGKDGKTKVTKKIRDWAIEKGVLVELKS